MSITCGNTTSVQHIKKIMQTVVWYINPLYHETWRWNPWNPLSPSSKGWSIDSMELSTVMNGMWPSIIDLHE